ncbi:recombinase family protein, partial [Methylobacterium sp. Leaf91]|uniref:recombinase family protein n=1 Tax=Methylobacterium sp. Leaf91 TaxID=1736247 RepID=UPI00138F717A
MASPSKSLHAKALPSKTQAPKALRCAIYTRKSTEHGLDQAFTSLDNQREAAEAYIKSQAHEGWRLLPDAYDDGGVSGGSLERPALQRLLAEVEAGRVDVVVVYKVDRLTRALSDFAKLVELFDAHGVSFVSVTQAFNTTNSMGRLTLNVLLSFAQFEREVTAERIRDKIAASKRKGMRMGGPVPLGYRVHDKKLVPCPDEAAQVRTIFERYLVLGCLNGLAVDLQGQGILTKRSPRRDGTIRGGIAFTKGPLAYLLRNRVYIGEVIHKDRHYPGEHEGIVPRELFDAVQAALSEKAQAQGSVRGNTGSWLMGLLYDDRGNRMTPSSARKGALH